MSDEGMFGFCMSVHREKINKDKQDFIKKVIDRFLRNLRRLQLLFLCDPDMCCHAGKIKS